MARPSGPALTASTASERLSRRHQVEVAAVAGGVTSVVASLALGADPAAIGTWYWGVVDSLISRIQAGYAINRNSTMSYLRQHARLNGASVQPTPGSLDMGVLRRRLDEAGPGTFQAALAAGQDRDQAIGSMARELSGVADETVRNGDRDVDAQAGRGRGVQRWRRRLSGRSCGFCAMLASRGAVYVTRVSATIAHDGDPYHHGCNCWAEPLYDGQQEPREVRELQRQWNRITAGHSGNDAINAWRRHWEQRATPKARARHGIPDQRTLRGLGDEPSVAPRPGVQGGGGATTISDLGRIADPGDIHAQAMATNPRYGQAYEGPITPEIEANGAGYTQNCTRVVIAYEMRRRGIDVTAGAGSPLGETTAAYVRTFRDDGRYAVRVADDLGRNMSARDIVREVESWPPGARGIVTMQGHTVNVERDAVTGRAVFIDAQAASKKTPVMDFAAFQRRVKARGVPTDRWMAVARVDDLDLSDYGLRYVEAPQLRLADGQVGKTAFPQNPASQQLSTLDEIARMAPDDTYTGAGRVTKTAAKKAAPRAPAPRSVTQLRKVVSDAGITVPTGLRRPALDRLVADLEAGVSPARAREAAVRTILEEREGIAAALSEAGELAANNASARALQAVGRRLRTTLTADQAKTAGALLRALDAGNLTEVKAALPVVARSAKLKAVASAGDVVPMDRARMLIIGSDDVAAGGAVRVVRAGYETTFERQTTLLSRVGVVRSDVPLPVKAAKKAAPRKAAPARVEAPDLIAEDGVARYGAWLTRRREELGAAGRTDSFTGRRAFGMDAVAGRQGFDGRPTVVSSAEMDRLIAGGAKPMYRGLSRDVDATGTMRSGAYFADQFREGEAFWAAGVNGSGVYFIESSAAAGAYADSAESILRAVLRPDAKVIDGAEVRRLIEAAKRRAAAAGIEWPESLSDRGIFAASMGYDAMVVRARSGVTTVVLNRTAVIVDSGSTRAAKAAAKKATPAKKAPAPKAPPVPEKMTAPALRKELQPVVADAKIDLVSVPKDTLAAWARRARDLKPSELAEEVGRWRQAIVDRRRALAEALSEADELLDSGATAAQLGARARGRLARIEAQLKGWPDEAPLRALVTAMATGNPATIRRAIAAAERKVGLKRIGDQAGSIGRYDAKAMTPLGGKIPDGAPVRVVRPGYEVEIGGQRVVLSKPVVEQATGVDALPRAAGAPTPAKAGAEAKAVNPAFGSTTQGPTYPQAPAISTSPRTGKVVSRRYTEDMGPLPSGAFEENCTNTVLAWDMRMRGFDVRAAPLDVLDRSGYAAGRTFEEIDELIERAYRLPNGRPHGRSFRSQQWRSFDEIEREILRDWPEGGRGFITVGKHVFNVIKRNGKMEFIEAQFDANASRIVTALYRRKYKSYPGIRGEVEEGKLMRLDDLVPADGILDSVRPV